MNNYNYLNNNLYSYIRNNSFMPNKNNMQELYSPKEGFEKGNMFPKLYNEYKNYNSQKLTPRTEQEERLLNIQAISFAAHDLNLYLDLHPEDQSMLMLLNDYINKKENLVKEYEIKYGPITLESSSNSKENFSWIDSPWPWEVNNV